MATPFARRYAAWDFMASQSGPTTLTAILPAAVLGPVLSCAENFHSVELVKRLLCGSLPRFPHLGFCVVDVRDVVDLHLRAVTAPEAAGQRFIAASDWMWMADVAHVLRSELDTSAKKVPTQGMPDVALFDRPLRFTTPLLGRKHVFSSAKAQAVLGWKPRQATTTLIDAARSAIAIGAV